MTDFIIHILNYILGHKTTKKLLKNSLVRTKYALKHIFYHQSLVQSMLRAEIESKVCNSEFLDYSLVIRNRYYEADFMSPKVRINGIVKSVTLPYKEIINYVIKPNSRISINAKNLHDDFRLSQEMLAATQRAFDRFKSKRMLISDDTSVRIKSLKYNGNNRWNCDLQRAKYSDQVRTNLTLDFPMDSVIEETMRTLDLDDGNTLRPFDTSILANTIGVSAIWIMRKTSNLNRRGKNLYFMMPRRNNTGVYNGMLGTISGVVLAPESNVFNVDFLEDYLESEIRREFYEESGINNLIDSRDIISDNIRIIPLAFVRDLTRGGKPQFFFLILTDYVPSSKITKAFKSSFNGMMEFDDSFFTRIPRYQISPETKLNLLYALSYVQSPKKLPFIDLDS